MKVLLVLLFFSLYFCCLVNGDTEKVVDYYWRDYTGKIPEDALEAGYDLNGEPTYIGQAYFKDHYLQVVRIYPGNPEVVASHQGTHKTKTYIKILCTQNKRNFRWMAVEGKNLHVAAIGKHLVRGGTENGYVLNIGRILYQGELLVGKVCSYGYNGEVSKLYLPYGNTEVKAELFEILIYENSLSNALNYDVMIDEERRKIKV